MYQHQCKIFLKISLTNSSLLAVESFLSSQFSQRSNSNDQRIEEKNSNG